MARLAGAEVPVLRRVAQPGDVDATAADLTRARDLLGYQPPGRPRRRAAQAVGMAGRP